MSYNIPFTADDLLVISKQLRAWEKRLVHPVNGYTKASELVNRIEVHRPDDTGEIIGHFVLEDGWLGFQFLKEKADD